jgi:hypothetical protein
MQVLEPVGVKLPQAERIATAIKQGVGLGKVSAAVLSWLNQINPGQAYGWRFGGAFARAGYRTFADLKACRPSHTALHALLLATDAKQPQFEQLGAALDALVGVVLPTNPTAPPTAAAGGGAVPLLHRRVALAPAAAVTAGHSTTAAIAAATTTTFSGGSTGDDHDGGLASHGGGGGVLRGPSPAASLLPTLSAPPRSVLPPQRHAFLSYQWDVQEAVVQIKDKLSLKGIKCWMDIDGGMKSDIYDSMAEGVQGAACVVCFMSQAYQDSVRMSHCWLACHLPDLSPTRPLSPSDRPFLRRPHTKGQL